ncbi:hypothetical protein JHL21_15160 [Devosia sp. WQ 349]|uniref:hypothetical protein n=1 Tax=Devosia sp. WQ 349K1 TaxID=2800329 RepID=UPI0019064956|nr:hypothetical protein [Devosia sp. WQ 349K1]MBK1795832.1 hypothetical protein [Devosia sp. WQ 349K1]
MSGRFLYLQNSYGGPPPALLRVADHTLDIYQQYDTDRLDWSVYDAVIISMSADQVHLVEITAKLQAYLNGGGTLVINGHVARPFLPELQRYEPMEKRGKAELVIHRETEHPMFASVTAEQLTLRKGVAGFYGRGSNPAPEGATVIHSVGPDHVAVDWLYERPEGGRIFVHSGVELWAVLMLEGPDQGIPVIQAIFDWLAQTSQVAA